MNTYRNPIPGEGRRSGNRRRPLSPADFGPTSFGPTTFGPEREQRRRNRDEHHHDHDAAREERRRERPGSGRGAGGRGGRRRDVRGAVLLVLAVEPMHGYQVMQALAERSGGTWRPSPGAIYPVLSALEDEGLVTISADSGRKVATLTEVGRTAAATITAAGPDPFVRPDGNDGPDLRDSVHALTQATREVARSGTREQQESARAILDRARRSLYALLAEEPTITPEKEQA